MNPFIPASSEARPEGIQGCEVVRGAVKNACIQQRQMKISEADIILILPNSHLMLPVIFFKCSYFGGSHLSVFLCKQYSDV